MDCIFGSRTKAFKDNIKFKIDIDDYDKHVKDYSFMLNDKGYAVYSSGNGRHGKYLHRIIMNQYDPKIEVDHIDGNPLNNKKSNLRVCTHQENTFNRSKYKNNKSGFKCVHFDKQYNKYRALIGVNGKQIHLGRFETAEAAHDAYKKAAVKYHKEFARF